MVEQFGLTDRVSFNGFVPVDQLVAAIADADAGVVAMKRDVFRDLTQCNKMFDLITMQVPAAVSRTRSVEAYFDARCFRYFTAGDERALAAALLDLHRDPGLREQLAAGAAEAAEPYRWPRQRELYLAAVNAQLRAGRR